MTHRLSNRCRVEKKKNSPRLFTHFLVYDHKTTVNMFFFTILFAPQEWAVFWTRTHRWLNKWCKIAKESIPRNGLLEWTNVASRFPNDLFFFSVISGGGYFFLALWFEKTLQAMTRETTDAGFKMRHTYPCHSVRLLAMLETNLRVEKKLKRTVKDVPKTLKKAICSTGLRLSRLTE